MERTLAIILEAEKKAQALLEKHSEDSARIEKDAKDKAEAMVKEAESSGKSMISDTFKEKDVEFQAMKEHELGSLEKKLADWENKYKANKQVYIDIVSKKVLGDI